MKKILFIALILFPFSVLAHAPQFANYPVTEIYSGINHSAIPNQYYDNSFSERQAALENEKVNYAGHYIIYTKQCGKDCITTYITDVKTGQDIASLGNAYKRDKQYPQFSIEHKSDSNLLIISNPNPYPAPPPPYSKNKEKIQSVTLAYWMINQGKLLRLNYYDFHQIEQNKADFDQYCKELNKDKPFRGTSDFLCIYPNKTIKDIHEKLKKHSSIRHFLKYPLPKIGKTRSYVFKNDGDDLGISYEWFFHNNLKIIINQLSVGKTIYNITQNNDIITVQIHTEQKHNKINFYK
ncbi:unnamed protein product [Commensalibacter communis]|uniref:Uncharacterized protein n=1 Tax=Commensalibacter communis TaxID=2972786 RepID=A0A9W4TPZ6_9PROT|nr:hypothetical protein [Commensalibacter communis]CAI3950593.1 unnamed protein product [Commensalibacter communis]CAI3952485.1 unnamed protein product [Commensalibacter communis]CAI3954560.1 unnamed protein product [Commensalibacter communis]CAI3954692.1 unnamed protein product [Commensalibacter communis]CAI3955074.1 unnamed protein product [Commensalibacter communis]